MIAMPIVMYNNQEVVFFGVTDKAVDRIILGYSSAVALKLT